MNKLTFERETLQHQYIDEDIRESYLRSITSGKSSERCPLVPNLN